MATSSWSMSAPNAVASGLRKLNLKGAAFPKQVSPTRRKLSHSTMPTLDESITINMLDNNFSLEFEPHTKPNAAGNSPAGMDQSENTLATVECSESSDFFGYDDSLIEIPGAPAGRFLDDLPSSSSSDWSFEASTPKFCSGMVYPGSPQAKRRRKATLSVEICEAALRELPPPPLVT